MEKYAVEVEAIDDRLDVKIASKKDSCPECGNPLPKNTTIPYCTYCGTKPFEKKQK